METKAPTTIEERIVASFMENEGCVKGEATLPPPAECSSFVHAAYGVAGWHPFTLGIAGLFALLLLSILVNSWKDIEW